MKPFTGNYLFAGLAALLGASIVLFIPLMGYFSFRPQYAFIVDVQMPYRPGMSNEETLELYSNGGAVPIAEFDRRGLGIPNNDKFFLVTLGPDLSLKLNKEPYGYLNDTSALEANLREMFFNRDRNGVLDDKTAKPIKDVMLRGGLNVKYGDVARLVDALKSAGADPIVLQIDDPGAIIKIK